MCRTNTKNKNRAIVGQLGVLRLRMRPKVRENCKVRGHDLSMFVVTMQIDCLFCPRDVVEI